MHVLCVTHINFYIFSKVRFLLDTNLSPPDFCLSSDAPPPPGQYGDNFS